MTQHSRTAPWIVDNQKYALVGLSVKVAGAVPDKPSQNLWALSDLAFQIPTTWKEWLGTIRTEEVEQCNLFLLSQLTSHAPEILDAEDQLLQRRVWNFYVGLLLSSTFAPAHRPVLITGSCRGGEIGIRQQQDLDSPIPLIANHYPAITREHIQLAAQLGEDLEAFASAPIAGGRWRLFRTLQVYVDARVTAEVVDRIHQYCRCVEGLILPAVGKSRQQFKSKTELFIGSGHHDLMGDIYDVRSAVEHLHESRYLESFDRVSRLDLVKKEAIVERIAREAIRRVMGNTNLWPHFANTAALSRFWSLASTEQRRLWGDTIDPFDALAGFDPTYINDGELGGP